MERNIDRLFKWLAWKFPKRLVTWCAVRMFSHAIAGQYSSQVTGDLRAIEALQRWG